MVSIEVHAVALLCLAMCCCLHCSAVASFPRLVRVIYRAIAGKVLTFWASWTPCNCWLRDEVGGSVGAKEGAGTCSRRHISQERVWSCRAASFGHLSSLGEPPSNDTAWRWLMTSSYTLDPLPAQTVSWTSSPPLQCLILFLPSFSCPAWDAFYA